MRILHPLWQGKDAFLNFPPIDFCFRYKHYKCNIAMLNVELGAEELGMPASGMKGHRRKRQEKSVAPCLLQVSARFLLSVLRDLLLVNIKRKWGQSVAWLEFDGLFRPLTCSNLGWSYFRPHFIPSVLHQSRKPDNQEI